MEVLCTSVVVEGFVPPTITMPRTTSMIHIPVTSPGSSPTDHTTPTHVPPAAHPPEPEPASHNAPFIPPHLSRHTPVLSSPYLKVASSPHSGFGVVATCDIPHDTKLLVCPGPVAYSISREHRKEACAWCFAYEDGKQQKVRFEHDGKELATPVPSAGVQHCSKEVHPSPQGAGGSGSAPQSPGVAHTVATIPANSGGLAFCSVSCRGDWEKEYGDIGKKAFMALENFIQKNERKKANAKAKPQGTNVSQYSDDHFRTPTPDEVESAWKAAQKQAFLIREYRFAQSNEIFALQENERVNSPSQPHAHACDCSGDHHSPDAPHPPSALATKNDATHEHAVPGAVAPAHSDSHACDCNETAHPTPKPPMTKFDQDFLKVPKPTSNGPIAIVNGVPSPISPSAKAKATTKSHRRAVHHAQSSPELDTISYDTFYYYLTVILTCYNQTKRANDDAVMQILAGHPYTKKEFKQGVDVPPNSFSELFSLYPQLPPYSSLSNLRSTIAVYLAILALDGLPTSLMGGCTCGVDPALMGNIPCMDYISREVIEAVKTRDVHNSFGIREHDELDPVKHARMMLEFEEQHKLILDANTVKHDASTSSNSDVAPVKSVDHAKDSVAQQHQSLAPVIPQREYTYFGSGTWTSVSFFNHSCIENVTRRREGRAWVFEACASDPALSAQIRNSTQANSDAHKEGFIPKGKDLCISYIRHLTHAPLMARRAMLRLWGFECRCELCLAQELLEMELKEIEKEEKEMGCQGGCTGHAVAGCASRGGPETTKGSEK